MATVTDLLKNLGVTTFLITTLWLAYAEPRIVDMMREEAKLHKGGLGSELTEKFGVPRLFLAEKIFKGIIAADSLDKFKRALLPMLVKDARTTDVGIKVDLFTKEVSYLHLDGSVYYPTLDTNQFYYFLNKKGQIEFCK